MSITDYSRLLQLFRDAGAAQLYVKQLAPNDNSKNQIYLGPDFQALNILPHSVPTEEGVNLKAKLDFYWLGESGELFRAPAAQLIMYPKYPEVRMSGFLKGCTSAPGKLMASRDEGRLLFLGVLPDNRIIGYVTDRDNPVSEAVGKLENTGAAGVFIRIYPEEGSHDDLITRMAMIHRKGWIDSKRLNAAGGVVPCHAPNCGGYTLEAELGVTPNGWPLPDYLGYEIKQYGVNNFDAMRAVSPVTLMTPEPTGGYYVDAGLEAFVRKYGYPDQNGREDRLNFGGIYSAGKENERTGLLLRLAGYDPGKGTFDPRNGGIVLEDRRGETAAMWKFSSLMEHWSTKHARAGYIPSIKRDSPQRQYYYGPALSIGVGTDFMKFLDAASNGAIYYDPGIKLENASSTKPLSKRRSQFRINVQNLERLYRSWKVYDLAVW